MSPITNTRVIYARLPTPDIVPGLTTRVNSSQTIDLDDVLLHGGFLLKTIALGGDIYQRTRMLPPGQTGFFPDLVIDEVINNFGVGKIIRSEDDTFKAGDYVYGTLRYQEYDVRAQGDALSYCPWMKIINPNGLPYSYWVGVLGLAGQTAYFGMREIVGDRIKTAKVMLVSAGASAVGSLVIQMAKRANPNIKVIASAGTTPKLEYMKSLGADVVFNYKTENTASVLEKHGPIDIYWDHVIGPMLSEALLSIKNYGLIVACGALTTYNGYKQTTINVDQIFKKSLSVRGFLVSDYWGPENLGHFYEEMPALIVEGKIKPPREQRYDGLKESGQALLDPHIGANSGKGSIVLE